MYVKELKINNYRNYKNQKINFDKGLNVIYGGNAQGKTNMVEAIYLCSIGKSFKSAKDSVMINFDSDQSDIGVKVSKTEGDIDIEMTLTKNHKKQIKVNGGYLTRLSDILGNLVTVFFSPDDLKLIKEAPGDRRKFLDISISQLSKRYVYILSRYQQILTERNNLLKSKNGTEYIKDQIDVWNHQLASTGSDIIIQRLRFVKILNEYAKKIHLYLTDNTENLIVEYQGISDKEEEIESLLYNALTKDFEKDVMQGYTGIGPHRDDLKLVVNGLDVKTYASQGQQRSVALSLKFAEKEILANKLGEYPITILDDVFSELDENRNKRILELLSKGQTFVTTTNRCNVGKQIKILNGEVATEVA